MNIRNMVGTSPLLENSSLLNEDYGAGAGLIASVAPLHYWRLGLSMRVTEPEPLWHPSITGEQLSPQ